MSRSYLKYIIRRYWFLFILIWVITMTLQVGLHYILAGFIDGNGP